MSPGDEHVRAWTFAVALLALAAGVTALGNGWTLDADVDIVTNPLISGGAPFRALLASDYPYPGPYASGFYRPVVLALYWVLWRFGGGAPAVFLCANVLLHAAVTLALLGIAKRLGASTFAAGAAAAIFAVHPVHCDVLAGVVGLKDLLAAAGFAGGLFLLLAARERAAATAYRLSVLGLAVFALGAFSKESALALPVVLLALDAFDRRNLPARTLLVVQYAGLLGIVALRFVLQAALLEGTKVLVEPADNPLAVLPFPLRPLRALALVPFNLGLLAWPARLSPDYGYDALPVRDGRIDADVLLGAIVLLAVFAGLAFAWRRRDRTLFAALAIGALAYLPTSNLLVTLGTMTAERFLYLPSMGFCLLAAWALSRARVPRAAAFVVLALAVGAGLVRSSVRNDDWQDNATLWSSAAAAYPANLKAVDSAAHWLAGRGEFDRAETMLRAALERRDDSPLTGPVLASFRPVLLGNLGTTLGKAGRLDEAATVLDEAVRLQPHRATWRVSLALTHNLRRDYRAALPHWQAAVRGKATSGEMNVVARGVREAVEGLGEQAIAWAREGRLAEAEAAFVQLAAAQPDNPRHGWNLGLVLVRAGREAEARAAWIDALARVRGDDPLGAKIRARLDGDSP